MAITPLKGDRAAHDVIDFPSRHASDLEAGTPIHHVPAGESVGDVLVWNGTNWEAQVPTPPASDLDDLTDVTISSPEDGQVIRYNSGTGKWENVELVLPASMTYQQFTYAVYGGDLSFIITDSGEPVMASLSLE